MRTTYVIIACLKPSLVLSSILLALTVSQVSPAEALPQGTERQTWQTDSGLPQNTVHALLQSRNGYIWIGTEGGFARFDGVRFQIYSTETFPQIQSNDVRALAECGDSIFAASAGGVVRVAGQSVDNYSVESGLPSSDVLSVACASPGELKVGTTRGWARWAGQRFTRTGDTQEPAAQVARDGILCQLRDREGNLWIGTETAGLTVVRRAKFLVYTTQQGLSGDSIRCVLQARDGSIWAGTAASGLSHLVGSSFTHLGVTEGLASDIIISLGEDDAGALYVGTPDGLNVVSGRGVRLLTSSDGLADDLIRSVAAHGKSIFVGTRRGVTVLEDGRVARTYTEANGLGSNTVGAMLVDHAGAVWIATLRGLSRLQQGVIRTFKAADGLPNEAITALYLDRDRNLWVGTQGGSLLCYSGNHFRRFDKRVGLPQTIYGISEDGGGGLWLASNLGLFRVARLDLLAGGGEAVVYGTSDGLLVNEASSNGHPTVWKARDGALWFATPRGLAAMTPLQAQLNRVPPPVVIEEVSIDDKPFQPQQLGPIAPGHNRYAFNYAGLSFVAPQKVRYRYKLEGFDANWIDAGTRRTAYYTSLPAGTYRFRVMARNNDGFWSVRDAAVDFTVEPHIYQRLWFLVLCTLALGSLVYGIYRLRVRQVAARYDAVLAERNRIAREIHDTLAQGFAGLAVQLELLSRLIGNPGDAVRQTIDESRQLVRDSLSEARRSIWELRSQSESSNDLASRLGKLTASSGGADQPRVDLEVQGTFRPLPAALEDELFRVAEEAVRNARLHARASRVRMTLSFGRKIVKLTVQDNGQGFDMNKRAGASEGHFGVDGMRERAERLGGTFVVESAAGQGTTVQMQVPVK